MIRGRDDGIVDALLEGTPLVSLVDVALTMLDSCDIDVIVLVAVGVMVCGGIEVGSLVDSMAADELSALEGVTVSEGLGVRAVVNCETVALSDEALIAVALVAVFESSVSLSLADGCEVAVSVFGGVRVGVPVVVV